MSTTPTLLRLTEGPAHIPRDRSVVLQELAQLRPTEEPLLLGGGEPTRSPHLLAVLRAASDRGVATILVTDGHALGAPARVRQVVEAGATTLGLLLRAPDRPTHEARAGRGTWSRSLRLIGAAQAVDGAHVGLVRLLDDDDPEAWDAAWVSLAARLGLALHLVGARPPAGGRAVVGRRVDRTWRAAHRDGVALHVHHAIAGPPLTVPADPPPPAQADPNLLTALERSVVPPSATLGVAVQPEGLGTLDVVDPADPVAVAHTAQALAGWASPAVDLPPCLGGVATVPSPVPHLPEACTPCPVRRVCAGPPPHPDWREAVGPRPTWEGAPPGGHVAVLVPPIHDQVMVMSTLPALAEALRRRGLQATCHTAWDVPFHPTDLTCPHDEGGLVHTLGRLWRRLIPGPGSRDLYLPPRDRIGHPLRWTEPPHRLASVTRHFWHTLDLSQADLIITPGFEAGRRAWEHPTRQPGARVLVADFHMLDGARPWMTARRPSGDRPERGTWWPGEALTVHACFPRYARLYRTVGVPPRQVGWRPYPLYQGHFTPGPPVVGAGTIFAGGRHFRDLATLEAAAARLPAGTRPIEVHAEVPVEGRGPLRPLGTVPLAVFYETIRRSRFVVVPLHHDATRAAGITVIAMALAAGRPVVATLAGGTLDHLRHGVDALLVPPGDPVALADAITRLDTDDALCHRMSRAALAAGRRGSVERWASEIVHGLPALSVRRDTSGRWRTW